MYVGVCVCVWVCGCVQVCVSGGVVRNKFPIHKVRHPGLPGGRL